MKKSIRQFTSVFTLIAGTMFSQNTMAAHFTFNAVADIQASNFTAADTAETRGYYQADGNGAANYVIWELTDYRAEINDASWTPDGYADHYTFDGKVAVLQNLDSASLKQYGAADSDHTDMLISMLEHAPEGAVIQPKLRQINLSDGINLNSGSELGLHIDFEGANITLTNDNAGFVIGQPGSGLSNANIHAYTGFTGVAIDVVSQTGAKKSQKQLSNINLRTLSQTGTGLRLIANNNNDKVTGLQATNINIDRFEYGVRLLANGSSNAIVSGNNFTNLIVAGQSKYDIHLSTAGNSSNQVSSNNFTNIQTQYHSNSVKHLYVGPHANLNSFTNFMGWDASGSGKLLFEILGEQNTLIGTIATSGGVSSFSASTNRLMQTDSGNQTNILQLGQRIIENSRYTHKSQTFSDADLPALDVRNGDVFIAKEVTAGTRLTKIIQGQNGQTVKIKFDGNTLLSNQWGGVGQFKLAGNASYYPANGAIKTFTYIDGVWYEGS